MAKTQTVFIGVALAATLVAHGLLGLFILFSGLVAHPALWLAGCPRLDRRVLPPPALATSSGPRHVRASRARWSVFSGARYRGTARLCWCLRDAESVLGVELDRLEPQRLHELGVVAPNVLHERLGVLAADEELDGRGDLD